MRVSCVEAILTTVSSRVHPAAASNWSNAQASQLPFISCHHTGKSFDIISNDILNLLEFQRPLSLEQRRITSPYLHLFLLCFKAVFQVHLTPSCFPPFLSVMDVLGGVNPQQTHVSRQCSAWSSSDYWQATPPPSTSCCLYWMLLEGCQRLKWKQNIEAFVQQNDDFNSWYVTQNFAILKKLF